MSHAPHSVSELPDFYGLIRQDHREVRRLFLRWRGYVDSAMRATHPSALGPTADKAEAAKAEFERRAALHSADPDHDYRSKRCPDGRPTGPRP